MWLIIIKQTHTDNDIIELAYHCHAFQNHDKKFGNEI